MKDIKKTVLKAAGILDDKKAQDIVVFDLGGKSSLCDYIILATAAAAPHLEALESEVSTKLKEDGVYKINREGGASPYWRVSDYGAFLLHIMTEPARNFYALDKLFSFAKVLMTNKEETKKPAAKKTKTTKKDAVKKSGKSSKKTVVKAASKTVKKAAAKKDKKPAAKKAKAAKGAKKILKTKTNTKKTPKKKGKK